MLDRIHSSIQRTKDGAEKMSTELDEHGRLIDRIEGGVTVNMNHLQRQTTAVEQMITRSDDRWFYVCVACLVIVIVFLLAL